jgi:hypothetical protein
MLAATEKMEGEDALEGAVDEQCDRQAWHVMEPHQQIKDPLHGFCAHERLVLAANT